MRRKILLFIFTFVLVLTGITNINAYDKYDGDYTIEYLLKNYNVVTLGTQERYNYSIFDNIDKTKGSVTNVFDIGGPVLIRGNYTGSTNLKWDNEYAQKTNGIPSYIKGHIGDKIKAGSIESAELSNIYVGSSNKVMNNDGYYTVNNDTYKYKYPVKVSDDYLDFDKLYASIVNEQNTIPEGTIPEKKKSQNISETYEYIIDKPGIYSLKSLSEVTGISFEQFDRNKLYIINIYDDFIGTFPYIKTTFGSKTDEIYCGRTNSCNYKGNIIWNFPNARYISFSYFKNGGHIIAPKADIEMPTTNVTGVIISNSLTAPANGYSAIQFYPYNLDEKLPIKHGSTIINQELDISDDLYTGNYSLDELLKNYSVITLGGGARLFHIAGQFLIRDSLCGCYRSNECNYTSIRLDFKSTDISHGSYAHDTWYVNTYDDKYTRLYGGSYRNTSLNPVLYFGGDSTYVPKDKTSYPNWHLTWNEKSATKTITSVGLSSTVTNHLVEHNDNYMDFKTLYDAIVEQQKKILEGRGFNVEGGVNVERKYRSYGYKGGGEYFIIAHIPIGGNYLINNVSSLDHIDFVNYSDNKDKLTVITIKDEGEIELPSLGAYDPDVAFYTNDWYGKIEKTYDKEYIQKEHYHGNIVWNIPNATKITFSPHFPYVYGNSPFIGHIIAPNAYVETPEFHFAGAMICKSLRTRGNTEAHFYPLTVGSVGTGIKKETKTIGGEVEKITISGTKTWDDNNNQDGLRPESVTINLLANGEKVDSVTITETDNWKYSFNVPRVDENGIKINYTITEDAIEHYATKIESFSNDTCPSGCKVSIDGYNITNSYTPKKTSLTVNKVWKDENNADKLRPESVEVELYANGKRVSSATLNEENNWTYIFNEIDMNENGKRIEYTVKEKEKIKGYTTSISGDQETGYTITNTHVVKKVNPTTGDNIKKFLSIFIMSLILLSGCVLILTKYRHKKA